MPEELHEIIWRDVQSKITSLQYARVIMPLSALLEGDFFNKYIKTGIAAHLTSHVPYLCATNYLIFDMV